MLKEFVRRAIVPAVENYFGLSERTIGPFPDDNTFMKSLWQLYKGSNDPLKEPYKNSVWTYAAINTIARNAAKVPLRLYKRTEPDKPLEQGSLYNLLRNPNPYMTHKVFIEAISIFLSIYGEATLLMNRKDVIDTPVTIWVLNPSRFEIVFNEKKNMMVGWIYHGTQDVPLKTYEVLLLKYFNPYNDLRGLSPLEPAQLAINNDWYASKYNENFFKQGAKTGGFITVDGELDDKQFNRMINQFEERHQGYERAHRIALLEGGAKFTEAKITQKDMEYIQLKKLSREEIFAAYKVNEVVLGIYEDVQCFHPDSSVLTDSGFIPVADVKIGTMLATLDGAGYMHFEPVTKTYVYDYDGDMYTQKTGAIDYMVTPEHKMYGRRKNCRRKSYTSDFVFERVSDIGEYSRSNAFVVPRNGIWSGKVLTEYSIDKRKYVGNGSSQGRKETLFPIVPFLKFLGWHLSEGCFREGSNFDLAISQSKEAGKNKFREDMKDFPYEYHEYTNQNRDEVTFVINGKDLYNYMLDNTGHYSEDRRIPRDILELHPDLLIHLFNALIEGDGCKIGKGGVRYDTTSKQLAEDVYELALRLGRTPILYGGKYGTPRRGNRRNKWSVYVPSVESSLVQPPLKPVKTPYKGKVYCFEVPPYHTVLSRYNGKSIIVSNSYEGIKMSHKAFWEEAMVPHLGYMEDYLNDTLFLQIEHGQYMVKFDLATVGELHDDYKSRVETAKVMNSIGFPINEINKRLQLGMPEFAWGNVWWVPMGMTPADIAMEAADNTPEPPKEPNDNNPDDTGTESPDDDTGNKPDKDDKKVLWQRYLSVQFRIEELFRNKVKKFIFEQRKMVLENIAKDKYPVFDYNKEVAKLQRLMNSLYVEALRIGATMVVEENGGSPLQFRLEHPEVVKYLETRGGLIPSKIMGTIYKGLEKIFSRKEAKELYAESVRILYNSITKRVGTIARTESSSVLVVGRVIQMQRLGCRYHQWITSRHDASRESHKELDGKIVKIGDSFREGETLRYPGDLMATVGETVNCRCFTIMVKSK